MLELLQQRRSYRRYKRSEIEKEKIDLLVKTALLSPSSRNLSPWEFIIVNEKSILKELSKCKPHAASFLKDAPLAIVVMADTQKSDVWVEDTSIASILIQLAAQSIGLGACWIQIRNRAYDSVKTAGEYIRGILNIPQNMEIESIIAVGYPDEQRFPHDDSELEYEKVYLNGYNKIYQ